MSSHIGTPTKETQLILPEIPGLVEVMLSFPKEVAEQLNEKLESSLPALLSEFIWDLHNALDDDCDPPPSSLISRYITAAAYYSAWGESKSKRGNLPVEALVAGAQLNLMAKWRLKTKSGAGQPDESKQSEPKEETGH